MIDTSKTNKELSDAVQYVIRWFDDNGFSGKLTVNNTSKTEFWVHKEGVEDIFTLTATKQDPRKCDIAKYMTLFGKSFAMKQEITRLKAQLNEGEKHYEKND